MVSAQNSDSISISQQAITSLTDSASNIQKKTFDYNRISGTKIKFANFDYGAYNHPLEFVQGRLPALHITSFSGCPGSDYSISFMGFNSVYGNTNSTILLNGFPIDNYLKFINYQDIDTYSTHFDDLKFPQFSAIAANGLLNIKTKIPENDFKVSFSSKLAISWLPEQVDVLSGDEFRSILHQLYSGHPEILAMAGNSSTNWQKEITRTGFKHDAYISVEGALRKFPMHFSYGNSKTNGIIRNSDLAKNTLSFNLSPSFLKNSLFTELNLFYTDYNDNKVDDNAFQSAILFAPSSPVNQDNSFGNYFAWSPHKGENNSIRRNPVALINQLHINEKSSFFNSGFKINYNFDKIDGLSAGINTALIHLTQIQTIKLDTIAAWFSPIWKDEQLEYQNFKTLINPYISYDKSFGNKYNLLFETGYYHNYNRYEMVNRIYNESLHYLSFFEMSAYATAKVSYSELYTLTTKLTVDNNPWFSNSAHLYPAISGQWNIGNEKFKQGSKFLSQLYFTSTYSVSSNSPLPHYDIDLHESLKPAKTRKFNAGLYAIMKNDGIGLSLNYYIHSNKNVYFEHSNYLQTGMEIINSFSMRNSGLILSIDFKNMPSRPIGYVIRLSANYNQNRIMDFDDMQGINDLFVYNSAFILPPMVYYPGIGISSFCLKQQEYDEDGKPIEGSYKQDGVVMNGTKTDFRTDRSSLPDLIATINAELTYKGFEMLFKGRIVDGNYVYNRLNSMSVYSVAAVPDMFLQNLTTDIYNTGFNDQQFYSDYYLENASFFKMDIIGIGYRFNNIKNRNFNIKLTGALQNAFTITKYKGLDPEVVGGFDNGQYPRARTFTVGMNFEF